MATCHRSNAAAIVRPITPRPKTAGRITSAGTARSDTHSRALCFSYTAGSPNARIQPGMWCPVTMRPKRIENTARSESPENRQAANMARSATTGERMIQKLSETRPAMKGEGAVSFVPARGRGALTAGARDATARILNEEDTEDHRPIYSGGTELRSTLPESR